MTTHAIHVEIKLFYDLAQYLPRGSQKKQASFTMSDGTTVRQLFERLGLPSQMPKTILVNGVKAYLTTPLHDHDSIAVFPPMAGG